MVGHDAIGRDAHGNTFRGVAGQAHDGGEIVVIVKGPMLADMICRLV